MSRLTGTFDPHHGLIVAIRIGAAGIIERGTRPDDPRFQDYRALIDTGARTSCISPQLARAAGLQPAGRMAVASAHGVYRANYYVADIVVPMDEGPPAVSQYAVLLEVHHDDDHQAIVGRDFLQIAQLTVDGPGGRFTMELPGG